jgi:hypothetical protein
VFAQKAKTAQHQDPMFAEVMESLIQMNAIFELMLARENEPCMPSVMELVVSILYIFIYVS